MKTLVTVVIPLGQDEIKGRAGPNTQARVRAALQQVYQCRHRDGDAVLLCAPGKSQKAPWPYTQTFAQMMEEFAHRCDPAIETIVNHADDDVWTTWMEVDWGVDAAKLWYEQNYKDQMDSWNDFTNLRVVFVSDKNHLWRIRLMAWYKLGHVSNPPLDDRYGVGVGGVIYPLVFFTEPRWGTVSADHPATPVWYELVATLWFLLPVPAKRWIRSLRRR